MGQLDNPEDLQSTGAQRDCLLATWWERVLAGVAVAFLMTLLADIIVRG
jgi:hypothetical protein